MKAKISDKCCKEITLQGITDGYNYMGDTHHHGRTFRMEEMKVTMKNMYLNNFPWRDNNKSGIGGRGLAI